MCINFDIFCSVSKLCIHSFQKHSFAVDLKNGDQSIAEMKSFRTKEKTNKKMIILKIYFKSDLIYFPSPEVSKYVGGRMVELIISAFFFKFV